MNGYTFYQSLQAHDGHWPGDYGGPMFLIGGLVIGSYVSGMPFKEEERLELIRYLMNRAHPDDGGWGLYVKVFKSIPWFIYARFQTYRRTFHCLRHGIKLHCHSNPRHERGTSDLR